LANQRLIRYLKQGGVIAYPTESCYGLGCDPKNKYAVEKILWLKKRSRSKGFILISSKINHLRAYMIDLSETQKKEMMDKWPGPHTWLVPASNYCPSWLRGGSHNIAIRLPKVKSTLNLLNSINFPITSTSANLSHKQSIKTLRACKNLFRAKVKIIDGNIGSEKKPTMIQDFVSKKIIRK
jgi:L-threonylcarbamoyladenylate synthase